MLPWEDQFTDCLIQVLNKELSSLSAIEVFTVGKLGLIEHYGCIILAAFRKKQQNQYAGLRYTLRKINTKDID